MVAWPGSVWSVLSCNAAMKERERMLSILARSPAMTPQHHNFHHGRLKHYPPQSEPRVIIKLILILIF